jgi:hypothetical protein
LIHLIAKVFMKMLLLRLAPKLGRLISANQNVFIPGRSLHDNFVLIKQSARLLHQLRAPCILLKLDLACAFDTVSWAFMFEVLRGYGFSDLFIDWLAILLFLPSTSADKWRPWTAHLAPARAAAGRSSTAPALRPHRRRSRSRAPSTRESCSRQIPAFSLYVDDMILFCHPMVSDVLAIKGILQLFGHASGLQVNFGSVMLAIELLGCPVVELPLTYLGIPLTIRRPTATQLQPLLAKMAAALPTWKAKLRNKAGRLPFIKAVLSAIPLHQLLVLNPSKKIVKQLQRIQHAFL